MKKTGKILMYFSVAAVILLLTCFSGVTVFAEEETTNDILDYLEYEVVTDDTGTYIKITDCDTSVSGDVVIPSEIDGVPVKVIGRRAFSSCKSLTNVTIPDSVTTINDGAFSSCDSITNITIPDGVTTIKACAFLSSKSLTNVTIPASVTTIGTQVFYDCESLLSVTVDENNEYYATGENGELYNKDKTELILYPQGSSLTEYRVPEGTKIIKRWAIHGCSKLWGGGANLTSIVLPSSLESLEDGWYDCCNKLLSITVDENNQYFSNDENGVLFNKDKTEILNYPKGKTNSNYVIPDGVKSLGYRLFYDNNSLKSVTIPDSVTSIGEQAFSGCINLRDLTLPDGVTSLGDSAFGSCTFQSITLPDSITYIGSFVFSGCKSLEYIKLPDGLTSISSYCFSSCTSLKIVVGANINTIISNAFSNCSSLEMFVTFADELNIKSGTSFEGADNAVVFVNSNAKLTNVSDNVNLITFSYSDSVLSFSGDYKSDFYFLFDLTAIMSEVYEDIDYLYFDSFEAVSADEGHIYYYTSNGVRKQFDNKTATNVKFAVEAFDTTGEYRQLTFNELCAYVSNDEISDFYLIIKEADGLDLGDIEISIEDKDENENEEQPVNIWQRILKAITNLLNKLFAFFKSFSK